MRWLTWLSVVGAVCFGRRIQSSYRLVSKASPMTKYCNNRERLPDNHRIEIVIHVCGQGCVLLYLIRFVLLPSPPLSRLLCPAAQGGG